MKLLPIAIYATGLLGSIYALPGNLKHGYDENKWDHKAKKKHHPPATTEEIHYQVAEPTQTVETTSTSTTYTEMLASYTVTPTTSSYYQTYTYNRVSYTYLYTITLTTTYYYEITHDEFTSLPGPTYYITHTDTVNSPTTTTTTEAEETTTQTQTATQTTVVTQSITDTTSTETVTQLAAAVTETEAMIDITTTTLVGAFTEAHPNPNITETVYAVRQRKELEPKQKWKHGSHYGKKKRWNKGGSKDYGGDDWDGKKGGWKDHNRDGDHKWNSDGKKNNRPEIMEKVYVSLIEPSPMTETDILTITETEVEHRTSISTITRTGNSPTITSWTTTTGLTQTSWDIYEIYIHTTTTVGRPEPVLIDVTVTETIPDIETITEHIEESTVLATETTTTTVTSSVHVADYTTDTETQVTDALTETQLVAGATETELVSDSTDIRYDVPGAFETVFVRQDTKFKGKKWKDESHHGKKEWNRKGGWNEHGGQKGEEW